MTPEARAPGEDVEGRWAVWSKNGYWFVCHPIDGDDCMGPFLTEDAAKRAAATLRDLSRKLEEAQQNAETFRQSMYAVEERHLAAEAALEEARRALGEIAHAPCITALLGEDYDDEGCPGCPGCVARRALSPQTEEHATEGEEGTP